MVEKDIVFVGELSRYLKVRSWDIHRLEKRKAIPRSRRMRRGKNRWRDWTRKDLPRIKREFQKYSDADRFMEKHKVNMDVRLNKQIVKFLEEVVASHSVIHSEERLSAVLVQFNLDKKEQPQSFELDDVLHREK